ncbi:phosphatidylinositol-specific phospholipase C1-like protein [Acidicapsa ligni]|uniref:phosphatidylinositol-specific phospholipase C1-like protein n=1 Tax=Acidicapsa ligni TaxID=542300 RepID=UPI0021E0E19C|nr:phosphatidylinositol-specific phospholipase C1-like protein [Acidicapsa ligni]
MTPRYRTFFASRITISFAVLIAAIVLAKGSQLIISPVLAQTTGALKLNQIQVIGTHNSYHAGIAPSETKLWKANHAEDYKGLEYKHQPLSQQLDSGVRQIELDVFADSKGGLYAHPAGPQMVANAHLPADPDFDPNGLMSKPGIKVMHVQDIDYRSTCQPFVGCLQQVRQWSLAHPGHIPIFILVETKQDKEDPRLHLTEPETFTTSTFDALDAEIRSVFSPQELIVPDDVRGSYETLNQAVLAGNWPTLASARGKVVFLMDQHSVGPVYLAGHPSLRGRVLFTNATPGEPDAAFVERNNGPASEITALVRQGYLIRARTDGDTKEARINDTTMRDAAMASGAQMLSTDYPINEPAQWPGHYVVVLPGAVVARCNPANSTTSCQIDSAK